MEGGLGLVVVVVVGVGWEEELDWVVVTWFHQVLENGEEMRS